MKKTYYGHGDVPLVPSSATSHGEKRWSTGNKELRAQSGSGSVEFYISGDIAATLTTKNAYDMGRNIYKSQDVDNDARVWGQMLCSAAEFSHIPAK